MKTQYEREYVDEPGKWEPVTHEEVVESMEGAGYWKSGTVVDMLDAGHILRTPFAFFRMKY